MRPTHPDRNGVPARLTLHHRDQRDPQREFSDDVARGLGSFPKRLPPKYFYDATGSLLFERITELPEYYLTRTETAILATHGAAIVEAAGRGLTLIELGSGSSTKTRLLLDHVLRRQPALRYIPIDVSASIVQEYGPRLLAAYPALSIEALICDYDRGLRELARRGLGNALYLFLGSSLGNNTPEEAKALLGSIRDVLKPGDRLLLGVDLVKDAAVLHRAYNDAAGVTATFNLNLLARVNRLLGGDFALERFRHVAFFDAAESRIEMHLESQVEQEVHIEALGLRVAFAAGERIHTENSYKYHAALLAELFSAARLEPICDWRDGRGWFAVILLAPA
jgi:dimethylhistidine N-methyltransferase